MHCLDCCSPPPLFNSLVIRAPVLDKGESTELQNLNARPPGETASALTRLCHCSGVFFLTGPASPGTVFAYSLDDHGLGQLRLQQEYFYPANEVESLRC